jgi:2-dehydro-3-deoxy-D-arabinonate dehydratase
VKLVRYLGRAGEPAVGLVGEDGIRRLQTAPGASSLSEILASVDPRGTVASLVDDSDVVPLESAALLPPVDAQEVWAAGVTYRRSQAARMEESEEAASYYDQVYTADRPELFMKATPHRVSGHGQPLRIRADSTWNVPEPELTLVVDAGMRLVGFTIGNDMSSRDIEGENPLYLPQAKIYDQCAGLGPWVTLADSMPPRETIGVDLAIRRRGEVVVHERTRIGEMARSFEDLIDWLRRDNSFPNGVMLMTGTGIVPGGDFTLEPGDVVDIEIDGIGRLSNPVVQGRGIGSDS